MTSPALRQLADPTVLGSYKNQPTKRIPELDGLRGIAILLVLVCHYCVNLLITEKGSLLYYARGLLSMTWTGVDLFFVLSGFLIGGILVDSKNSPRYFQTFYIRRFFRIFPLYYIVLTLFITACLLLKPATGWKSWLVGDPLDFATYATFTQNIAMAVQGRWGPNWTNMTWSLAVEEQFYLLLPVIVYWIPHRFLKRAIVSAVLLAPTLRMLLFWLDPNVMYSAYALMPTRADSLGLGVLAALIIRDPGFDLRRPLLRRALVPVCSIFVLGMGVLTATRSGGGSLLLNSLGYTWISCFYLCLLLIALLRPDGLLGMVCKLNPLKQIGYISYCVYLIHQPILGFTFAILRDKSPEIRSWSDVAVVVVSLAVVISTALLSWKFLEQPLIRRGHSYRYE